jgi:hypothetical protein
MPAVRRQPIPARFQELYIPAPTGGLNTVSPGGLLPDTDCLSLWNMVVAENGLRSRLGSREWCTGLTGASDNLVRSVLPFKGSQASKDRVFACTSSGIWDVTSSSAAPTLVIAFADTTGDAGYGVAHALVTAAGHFLAYADEQNGLYYYTESTDTWAKVAMGGGASQISVIDPASIRFVTTFKHFVIFALKDSQSLYYLASGSIYGAATAFPLAGQFLHGGNVVGMWSCTYDGGAGMDDSLVVIAAGGDLVIYQGTDITTANSFGLKGRWFLGGIPAGRHIASNIGGDLLIITKMGLLPLSRLVTGAALEDSRLYETFKVSNLFNQLMLTRSSLRGWSIRLNPEDNTLLVTVPTYTSQACEQLAMSVPAKSWSRYDSLGIGNGTAWSASGFYSSETHAGKLYFGTVDGRVLIHDGYVDGVLLSDSSAYTSIQWRVLTGFRNLGNGRQKQVQHLRPIVLSETAQPSYDCQAKYDYDLGELAAVSVGAPGNGSWGVGVWDTAVWGDGLAASIGVTGAAGMGSRLAIAMRGAATGRTIIEGWDVAFTQGGWL